MNPSLKILPSGKAPYAVDIVWPEYNFFQHNGNLTDLGQRLKQGLEAIKSGGITWEIIRYGVHIAAVNEEELVSGAWSGANCFMLAVGASRMTVNGAALTPNDFEEFGHLLRDTAVRA